MNVWQILDFFVLGIKLFSDSLKYDFAAVFEVILELSRMFLCKVEKCLTPRGYFQSVKLFYAWQMPCYTLVQRSVEEYAFSYKVTFVVVVSE